MQILFLIRWNLIEDKSINPSIDTADTDENNGEMDGSMNIDNQNSEYRNIVAKLDSNISVKDIAIQ